MNTKSKLLKSIFISLILVMGVNNAWAYDQSAVDLYFDNSTAKWTNCYVYIGHGTWTSCYAMSRVSGTQYLWKLPSNFNSGNKWGGASGWVVSKDKWWDSNGEDIYKFVYHGNNNVTNIRTSAWNATTIYKADGTQSVNHYSTPCTVYKWTTSTKSNYTVTINSPTGGTLTVKDYDNNAVATGASKIHLTVLKFSASPSTGYTFGGVEINNGSSTTTIAAADIASKTYTLTSDVTITPIWTEKTYSVSISAGSGGTVSPSGSKTIGQVTKTTVTATPNTNYEFVNWTATGGVVVTNTSSASTTITATADGTLKANFRSTATHSLTVVAGEGIASVTGSKDPVTLNSTYSITATLKTGYTFSTWTANPAANASFGSATTANTTVTVKNGSVTVTATATENMSTLTTSNSYTEGTPGYAVPTASVNSIGYETTATVTATAAGNGYTFTGWTLTNCTRTDGGAVDATSITVRSNGDGATATVIANYEKIPSKTVYINPKTGWKETLNIICDGEKADMTPVGCDGYYTAEVPGGTTELKFGGNDEQTLPLTIPQDDKVLYDMTSTNITKLYLKPNANWKSDGARFAAYFFDNGETWVSMTAVSGETDLYEVNIPTSKSYPKVIFVRMNGANQTNNWSNKWNQTGDLAMPINGTNQYTINDNSWDAGSWHKVWDNSCWTTYEPSNTYTISFNRQGATTGSESVTATLGEKPATIDMPERTGYTFNGYYTAASEGTQIINAEGEWKTNTTYVDEDGLWQSTECDITLYAQWTEKLSTITIIVSEGGSVKVDEEDFESGNTVQVGVATSKTITLHPNAGYGIDAFGVTGDAWISGNGTYTLTAKGSGSTGTLYANFVALEYTITWNPNGGKVDPATSSYTYNGTTVELPTPTRDGFTFVGWFTEQSGGTQITEIGTTNKPTSDVTYYAHWQGAPYSVGLDQEGAATSGTEKVTAYYEGDMPTADVIMPTAQNGYAFMGYWDKKDGQGTQYYNADGTSAHVWDKAEDATLYAYFKMAEITTITLDKTTFEPVEAGSTGFVTATPIIEPTPTGTTTICWRLLYSNGTPVEGHNASTEGCEQNQVKFSIAGLASGNYKIEAVLRTGNNCESGTELSTKTVNFTIASTYTITVKYTCDGKEIMAASKLYASISSPTTTTAPTIPGYTFSKWVAGDGVTIIDAQNGEKTDEEIEFTAFYDGYLTAQYTTRPMVYFKNTLGWEKVYVYTFSDNAWWNDDTGVHPATNKLEQGEMKLVEGTDDIYYFELTNTDGDYTQENNANNNYIAFSSVNYIDDNDKFKEGQAVYRGDHKNNLTLFIPQEDQEPEKPTNTQTQYYNKGIWMKYNSTESGYQIPSNLPSGDWNTYTDNFTTTNPGGYTFSITKNLAANTEYEFKIRNYVWIHNDWEDNGNGKDNHQWFGYDGTITQSVSDLLFHDQNAEKKGYNNTKIKTTAAGEYIFTIDLSTGKVILSVEYPVAVGDYRVVYTDNAKWSDPRNAHNNTNYKWNHPSRVIKKNTTAEEKLDTISFFISREQGITYSMKFQQCTNIANNGTITWADGANIPALKDKGESGVYNFVVTQTANGESISMGETVEPYSGNYYIRCDVFDGGWDNYKTNSDNRIIYSAFSESDANSFGDKFSHYATKYVEQNHNIKFTIANDYSPCISDTLTQDFAANGDENPFGNLDENGTLYNDGKYNANVRFMWNRKTNKISRAYVGPASENNFLVLKGNEPLDDKDVNKISSKFTDTQNWIYELNIKVKPQTLVKLYACYPKDKDESGAQYFRGTYNTNQFVKDTSAVQILGGDDSNFYDMRVLYDFKTNRLMAAWMPSGNIEGAVSIDADVMILREHQKDAACITLTNDDSKLLDVKTVYGVMRFNRWVLNNRDATKSGIEYCTEKINNQDTYSANVTNEHHPILDPKDQKTIYERALYFISFPFDVHLSDVFGFGTYGTHWVISTYNGLRRAQKGYFIETCYTEDCTNWDYIWDPSNFVLKANTGYLLSLDLDLMKHDNMNFWLHNIENVELYFPSQSTISTIERTHYTMPKLSEEDYECTINFNKANPGETGYNPDNDHRVRDSYWRCIGVPSFANYDGSLYKTAQDADNEEEPIIWNTNYEWKANNAAFPFLYEWNVQDNSLHVQSTNKYKFRSTFAYLVQNGNPIYWSAVNTKPSNIVARSQEAKRNYEWRIAISRNGEVEDQAFVRLSDNEQVTTEFDFNQDLSKEFNYGRSDIYTFIGYEKAAANSLPLSEQTTLIPLGLSIEYNGDYTIAMPDGTANIGVTLIDTESNTRTNLSAGMEYTLTLNKGDYNNRFFIEISPIQQTPTDIEYVTGDSNSQNSVRKVLIDNILYIVRDGQMFDARGARVQ